MFRSLPLQTFSIVQRRSWWGLGRAPLISVVRLLQIYQRTIRATPRPTVLGHVPAVPSKYQQNANFYQQLPIQPPVISLIGPPEKHMTCIGLFVLISKRLRDVHMDRPSLQDEAVVVKQVEHRV